MLKRLSMFIPLLFVLAIVLVIGSSGSVYAQEPDGLQTRDGEVVDQENQSLKDLAGKNTQLPSTSTMSGPDPSSQCAYMVLVDGNNLVPITTLYDIDLATGVASNPRSTGIERLTGIALGPDGYLYAVRQEIGTNDPALFKIDPTTGTTTFIGLLGIGSVYEGDLAFDPSGVLYGIGKVSSFGISSSKLYTINLSTGAATIVGFQSTPSLDYSYLAFDDNGTLYAIDNTTNSYTNPATLVTLDPSNANVLTSLTITGLGSPGGMDFDPVTGLLYVISSALDPLSVYPGIDMLYTLDPTTGTLTNVGAPGVPGAYSGLTLCASSEPLQLCVDPPDDMVAWYPFDDEIFVNDGAVWDVTNHPLAFDIQGLHNGQKVNGPNYGTGMVAEGLVFDGINDYVEIPSHDELNFGAAPDGDFSIDFWIKTSSSAGIKLILDKRTRNPYRGYSVYLHNGRIGVQLADGNGYTNYNSNAYVADNEYHLVAITVDRDSSLKVYLDGDEIQSFNPSARPGSLNNDAPLRIGRHSFGSGHYFQGILDEVELFNRALTEPEVLALYEAGEHGKCKDPCPALVALSEDDGRRKTEDKKQLVADEVAVTLRQLRDQLWSKTDAGQHYTNLFEEHSLRMSYLLLREPELRHQASQILYEFAPGIQALLDGNGREVVVTEEMVNNVRDFLVLLAEADAQYEGGELAKTIEGEMSRIEWRRLSGMTFDQGWKYINSIELKK